MSSAHDIFEVGSTVLGYVGLTASWRRCKPDALLRNRQPPMLVIASASTTDDGVHEPASSVTIGSRAGLLALRDAIDEALKEGV